MTCTNCKCAIKILIAKSSTESPTGVDLATERTPEEIVAQRQNENRIKKILANTTQNIASWMIVHNLDEHPEICEFWVDRMWDYLRDSLDSEDMINAILYLLRNEASDIAASQISSPIMANADWYDWDEES